VKKLLSFFWDSIPFTLWHRL